MSILTFYDAGIWLFDNVVTPMCGFDARKDDEMNKNKKTTTKQWVIYLKLEVKYGFLNEKVVIFEQSSKEYMLQDILAVRTPELFLSCQACMKSVIIPSYTNYCAKVVGE